MAYSAVCERRAVVKVVAEALFANDPVHAPLIEEVEGGGFVEVEALVGHVFDDKGLSCLQATSSLEDSWNSRSR